MAKLNIKNDELKKYLDITNTIDFKEIEPNYFKIKSDTRTNRYVRDFCQRNKYNKILMSLVKYFFEKIYSNDKYELGIANNIMVYRKNDIEKLEDKFLFAFIGGMHGEKSYFKLKYRGYKTCINNIDEESLIINEENFNKILGIMQSYMGEIK